MSVHGSRTWGLLRPMRGLAGGVCGKAWTLPSARSQDWATSGGTWSNCHFKGPFGKGDFPLLVVSTLQTGPNPPLDPALPLPLSLDGWVPGGMAGLGAREKDQTVLPGEGGGPNGPQLPERNGAS